MGALGAGGFLGAPPSPGKQMLLPSTHSSGARGVPRLLELLGDRLRGAGPGGCIAAALHPVAISSLLKGSRLNFVCIAECCTKENVSVWGCYY